MSMPQTSEMLINSFKVMKIIEKLYKKYYDLTGQANRLEVLVPVYRQSS